MSVKEVFKKLKPLLDPGPSLYDFSEVDVYQPGFDKKLKMARMAQLMHHTSAAIHTRFLFCLIFAFLTWSSIGGWIMGLWLAFVLMHSLATVKSTDDFFDCPDLSKEINFWKTRTLQMVFVSGLTYGFAGVMFMQAGQTEVQMLLIALIVAVTFGSMPLYSCWLPAFWAFLIPVVVPTIIKVSIVHSISIWTVFPWLVIIFLLLFYFSKQLNAVFSTSLYRNFEKESLVEELIQQRQSADLAKEAAEMAIESKTKFFAAANHDLRQPLQAMGIFISILENQVPAESKSLVLNLASACRQVSTLVDQILILSKLDSGSMRINPTTFNLTELFNEMVIEFEPVAEDKELAFIYKPLDASLCTDAQLLSRVVRNLLSNAFRYTTKGTVSLKAEKLPDGTLYITVSDTGKGIGDDEKKDLFKEYFRGESGYAAKEGFGLGLSIVKKICDLLSFTLTFESKKGQGTIFRLEIPVSREINQVKLLNKQEPTRKFFSLKNKRVLIIEDDPLIRRSLQALLEAWGAKVRIAEYYDAQLAAELVVSPPLDIILTDFNLGPNRLTGLQAVLRIRSAVGRKIPAIVMTATAHEEVMKQYEEETEGLDYSEYGTDLTDLPTILQKPVSPTDINTAISRLLGQEK